MLARSLDASRVQPQLLRRDGCALGQCFEFRPDDGGMNFRRKRGLGGKPTVAAANHVLAPHELGIIGDATGD